MNIIFQNNGISYTESGSNKLYLGLILKGHKFVETVDVISVMCKSLGQAEIEMREYNVDQDSDGLRVRGLVACSLRDLTDPAKFGKVVTSNGEISDINFADDFQGEED
jgi:hypothetical protein